MKINIFWFRRDLRLADNKGLFEALKSANPVIPLSIFDTDILSGLEADDPRINFIHEQLAEINQQLKARGTSLLVRHGKPEEVWESIAGEFKIGEVFCNHDYEPYAIQRDSAVREFLSSQGIRFHT